MHGFVDDFRNYRQSSYQLYLSQKGTRLNTIETLKQFGGVDNFKEVHAELAELPDKIKLE